MFFFAFFSKNFLCTKMRKNSFIAKNLQSIFESLAPNQKRSCNRVDIRQLDQAPTVKHRRREYILSFLFSVLTIGLKTQCLYILAPGPPFFLPFPCGEQRRNFPSSLQQKQQPPRSSQSQQPLLLQCWQRYLLVEALFVHHVLQEVPALLLLPLLQLGHVWWPVWTLLVDNSR